MNKLFKYAGVVLFLQISITGLTQENNDYSASQLIEERIEYLLQNTDATDIDLTTLFEQLYYYLEHPLNLNSVNRQELKNMQLLNDFQIESLLLHRKKYGNFETFYELRDVPNLSLETIQKILPFLTIEPLKVKRKIKPKNVLKYGKNQLIIRHSRILPNAVAYNKTDTLTNSQYIGDPNKMYARYRFRYSDVISVGVTAEKDAGEAFGGPYQPKGFDFYSAHIALTNLGWINKVIIGDYQLQIGQGLTSWTGFGLRKSPTQTLNIKRFAQQIKPYTSTDENNFLRGAATVLGNEKIKLTLAYSKKSIDGNINQQLDTLTGEYLSNFSSLQTNGFHRSINELENKDALNEQVFAGRLGLTLKKVQLGIIGIQSNFDKSFERNLTYYQYHEFQGKNNSNFGIDYQYSFGKFYFFGETVKNIGGGYATLNGLLLNLDDRLNVSILQRNYAVNFRNLYANGFGEKNGVRNESGVYFGVEMYPVKKVILNAYYDLYSLPWLSYQADAPTIGQDFSTQLTIKPTKKQELILLYRLEQNEQNAALIDPVVSVLTLEKSYRYRLQYGIKFNSWFNFRTRLELRSVEVNSPNKSIGYLYYNDFYFNLLNKKMTLKIRYAVFDAMDFEARIYAYEHDLLYQFSVPFYYLRGSRVYGVIRYKMSKNITLNVKLAQTFLSNRTFFGSGRDLIKSRTRTELKSQLIWKF